MPQWQTYTDHTAEPASGDTFLMRDVSDTTAGANGTVKEIPYSLLRPGVTGGAPVQPFTVQVGEHFLTVDEGVHTGASGLGGASSTLRVPSSAPAGTAWQVVALNDAEFTVTISGGGSINGVVGGQVVSAPGPAWLSIQVLSNPSTTPDVWVIGDIVGDSGLVGNLFAGGHVVTGYALGTGVVNGTMDPAVHNGRLLRTSGSVTVPQAVGFNVTLIAGGAHTVSFGATTSPAMAVGDLMSIAVADNLSIHAVLTRAANKVAFA
jgi:hypothetical protein